MHFTIIATSLFAIIGGPSVGKTSIINALHEEGHLICRETATDIILAEQTKGHPTPWNDAGFEVSIFDEKIRREDHAQRLAKEQGKSSIFIDRGLLDQLVYIEVLGKQESEEAKYIQSKLTEIKPSARYKAIFFVEPYNNGSFEITKYQEISSNESQVDQEIATKIKEISSETGIEVDVRREDANEARIISEKLKEVYSKTGIPIITVPTNMTPKERALFIIEETKKIE